MATGPRVEVLFQDPVAGDPDVAAGAEARRRAVLREAGALAGGGAGAEDAKRGLAEEVAALAHGATAAGLERLSLAQLGEVGALLGAGAVRHVDGAPETDCPLPSTVRARRTGNGADGSVRETRGSRRTILVCWMNLDDDLDGIACECFSHGYQCWTPWS